MVRAEEAWVSGEWWIRLEEAAHDVAHDISVGLAPLLSWQLGALVGAYFGWKLLLRAVLPDACVEGPRGWPRETFWSAFLHQTATLLVWGLALASAWNRARLRGEKSLDSWLAAPWSPNSWDTQAFERLCLGAQIAEMITDTVLFSGYSGYDAMFWTHHLTTFFGTCGFYTVTRVPVGASVCFGSAMECGSIALNACSLWPSPRMYRARVIMYSTSRVFATYVIYWVTARALDESLVTSRVALLPLLPLWACMAVNWAWCYTMVKGQLQRELGLEKTTKKKKG